MPRRKKSNRAFEAEMKYSVKELEKRMDRIEYRMDKLEDRIDRLANKIDNLKDKINGSSSDLTIWEKLNIVTVVLLAFAVIYSVLK